MDMKLFEDVWHFVKSSCDYCALVIKGNDAIHLPPQGRSCRGCLRAYLLPFFLMKRGLEWLEMVFERDAVWWVSMWCLREEWDGLEKNWSIFFYGSIFCVLLRYQVGTKLLIWNIKEAAMTGRGLAKRRRIPAPNMFSLGCLLQLQSVPWVCAGAWEQHRYMRRLWALPGAKKEDKKSWIVSRVWEFHLLCDGFRRVNLKQALHCVLYKTGDLMKEKKEARTSPIPFTSKISSNQKAA